MRTNPRSRLVVAGLLAAATAACSRTEPASSSSPRPGQVGATFLITVQRPEHGTVSSADGRITCGSAPSSTLCGPTAFAWTETVTLVATADQDHMLGTFVGDCSGRPTNPAGEFVCVLDTTRFGHDRFVGAVFGPAGRVQHANFSSPAIHGPEFLSWMAREPDAFECGYCHGATYGGRGLALSCNECHARAGFPSWLTDCGFCHGAPPETAAHGVVPADLRTCGFCHSETVDADGTLLAGAGKHMNGVPDVRGGAGGAGCASCHGAPPATGAHLGHRGPTAPSAAYGDSRPLGCGNCHPTDPARHGSGSQVLNPDISLPGGTRTTGAVMTGSGITASCSVACHFPLGAPSPAAAIGWNTGGPLACKECHSRFTAAGLGGNPTGTPPAGPSLHDPLYAEARPESGELTTCWSCHDSEAHAASHVSGDPALLSSTVRDTVCVSCHSPPAGPTGPSQVLHRGSGADYEEKTPPVLVGWTDAVNGDFHGVRTGAGYGGTLDGFVRGQGPLSCSACHASHASGNAFKFAAVVNGKAVPGGRISRSGTGAELLCKACHLGENHEGCIGCHPSDPRPAGTACFLCHGHEGVRRFAPPYIAYGDHDEPAGNRDCSHCHGSWAPAPDHSALTLSPWDSAPRASAISATSATISWATNRAATTYVEYGIGTAGYVVGNGAEQWSHTVTLAGLAPSTTYVWRIRSADASRNVVRSETQRFTTTSATAVPAPDVAPVSVGPVALVEGDYRATAQLRWYPVTAPSGTTVQYEVQLASDVGFTSLENAILAITDPDLPTGNSGWIPGIPTGSALGFDVTLTNLPLDDCSPIQPVNEYRFQVRARDARGTVSDWSLPGLFSAGVGDPYCG